MSDDSLIEKIVKKYENRPDELISILQETQSMFGYLPEKALDGIANGLRIPSSRIYGVATFYTQFRLHPLGRYVVRICHGTACHVTGSDNLSKAVEEDIGIKEGGTTPDGLITLDRVACLGCCSLAPTVMINDKIYGKMTHDRLRRLIRQMKEEKL
jgi:NADH-quinone oxidoreductase subunit E